MTAGVPRPAPQRWWVVVNGLARGPKGDRGLAGRLQAVLGARGFVSSPESLDDLHAEAHRARAEGVDAIAIVGGDGTAHRVATAVLMDAWADAWSHRSEPSTSPSPGLPAIALPGGGTMNTISRGLGLRPGRPVRRLRALIEGPVRAVRQAPLVVDGTHAGWLFGIGITPRFIEAYEADGTPSPARAAWTLGRALVSVGTGGAFADRFFEPIPATLRTAEGQEASGGWLILMAGAAPSVGLDFRPFPPSHDPRSFGVFGTRSTPAQLARDLVTIRRHRPVSRASAWTQRSTELVITAQSPLHLQLDGDLWPGGTTCTLRAGPIVDMLV